MRNDFTADPGSRTPRKPGATLLGTSAGLALFWERFWPLAVPPLGVIVVFCTFSWLGMWQYLPNILRYAAIAGFSGLFCWAAWGLRHLALPGHREVARRIETASGLENRPVTAQEDAIALGRQDALAQALWHEHRQRMAKNLRNLTAGMPAADANRTDPYGLRACIAATAFAAFGFSFGPDGGSVRDAFSAAQNREQLLTRLDAWINPPAYTQAAPVFLTGKPQLEQTAISVPQGSEIFLRFVGNANVAANFQQAGVTVALPPTGALSAGQADAVKATEFSATLENSGTVSFLAQGEVLAGWNIEIVPDLPPSIKMTELPSAALSGSLQLTYEVEDDYGVSTAVGNVVSALPQDPGARPLVGPPELPLALPRQRATRGTAKVNRDLSRHPLAGSPVVITLTAIDAAGQSGSSQPHKMLLPGRNFSNPLALALIEQRTILALDANKQRRVADMLDATLTAPEDFIAVAGVFIALKVAWRRIVSADDDDALRSSLDLLWDIALAVEFGDLSEAERKLRDAQERLSDALENGASEAQVQKLMQELREAMSGYMEQLAREAKENPGQQNPLDTNPLARTLRQRDLERMLDQIENLAKSGSKDAARQMLSELQRMIDNLRAGRHIQQRQSEGSQMNQALDQLSQLMRKQQQLMDETFKMQQQQNRSDLTRPGNQAEQQQEGRQPGEQQQGSQPGSEPMTPQQFADALKKLQEQQDALQDQLGKLGKELEELGLEPTPEFGEAGREMGEAGKDLGRGNAGDATGNQADALRALRQGVQQMMQQMAGDRQKGGQKPGEGEAGQDRLRSDPLGRQQGESGLDDSDITKLPGEIDAQRAREIMEAIRNRLARPNGPLIEKRYLERLLETD